MSYREWARGVLQSARRAGARRPWVVHAAVALACTCYLDVRARLVPRWGEWYLPNEGQPYVLLQVRALLSGKLALLPHATAAGNDYNWGRGGMHTAWGLGVPILATPFYVLGRLFGAPGFPDNVQFLILYGVTAFLLASALYRASRDEDRALFSSAAAAGFVMVFPTFVGMVTSRFLIYELTIATGAVWSVLQLAGILALLHKSTPARLIVVCVVAGFSAMIRPPIAVYGLTTAVIALIVASRKGVRPGALLAATLAYVGTTGLYFVGNVLRFGSPFATGYENCISGAGVNRMNRWGLPYQKVPVILQLREQFANFFLLRRIWQPPVNPPDQMKPYLAGLRYREYYAPTFDRIIFAAWVLALGLVCWRIVRNRLWRRDRDLGGELVAVVGAWALPPSIVLFFFYARIGNMVTRYATDLYPALAAACLCVGVAAVDNVRRNAPNMTLLSQLAITWGVLFYLLGWRGWVAHLSHPSNRAAVVSRIERLDARRDEIPNAPSHFTCGGPRGEHLVHNHLDAWGEDCAYKSALVFSMPYAPCVAFTLASKEGAWSADEDESLDSLRATADFDHLVSCGAPRPDGEARRVTLCEPHAPAFLLDGQRLYAMATLDRNLNAIDRLYLTRIDATPSCP